MAFAAFIPLIAAVAGPLLDKVFGDKPKSPEQVAQQQQELNRFDVTTPFGMSRWNDDNSLTQELSPQMAEMMGRQFDYRNSALANALDWFGGPPPTATGGVGDYDPGQAWDGDPNWSPDQTPAFPNYNDQDRSERMDRAVELWGKDTDKWPIPLHILDEGKFPRQMTPSELATWWLQRGLDDVQPGAIP